MAPETSTDSETQDQQTVLSTTSNGTATHNRPQTDTLPELTREELVHCKVGGRSAQAYDMLKEAGYTKIKNLKGGILAWVDDVDRTMQKY